MSGLPQILEVLPTRVRRNYGGGALLESWTQVDGQGDGNQPEDWIASTVPAVNPSLPRVSDEGLTRVCRPGGKPGLLAHWLAREPEYFLGQPHLDSRGVELGFLAKLLDSSIRLHVQAHPTAAFAQQYMGSRYGKLETYVILAFRDGASPYLRLGFQHAPSREEWRRIIAEQDIAAMDRCFEPIPLSVGEIWRVPGGMPHAIGPGVLMLEVMEPSDLVVRCEFEREGIVLPPEGRFMGRDLDFCLNVFDYQSRTVEEIRRTCQLKPRVLESSPAGELEELVGREHTNCFVVRRMRVRAPQQFGSTGSICLLLVVSGTGAVKYEGGVVALSQATRLIIPASANPVTLIPDDGVTLEILLCQP